MKWLLITTIGKNPGDEWIRVGIQKMIHKLDAAAECILLDKENPAIYRVPVEFDKCIWCGMPVFWSMQGNENSGIPWWKALMLGWPSAIQHNFMLMGAGSFFPWGREVATTYNMEQLIKSAKDVLERSYCVTARDPIVSKVTGSPISTMICPAIFSVIDNRKSHELKLANLMPRGGHYAVFGPQEAKIWNEKKSEISQILQKNNFVFVAHNAEEKKFAETLGWKDIISYKGDPNQLMLNYGKCGKFFGNRVHGAILARGNNADVWSVGYDSRQEAVRLSGAKVSRPSELVLSEVADWASHSNEVQLYDLESNFKSQIEIIRGFMNV